MIDPELTKMLIQYFGVFGFIILLIIFGLFWFAKNYWFDKRIVELQSNNEKELNRLKNELDIYKEKVLKGHIDKIETYRLGADILAEILGDLDVLMITGNLPLPPQKISDPQILQRLSQVDRASLKVYGYLAILAPQNVMDAYDNLRDHLDSIFYRGEQYVPENVHQLALNLANEIRKDIGINETPLVYKGERYKINKS